MAAVRQIITERANNRCEYCLSPAKFLPFTFNLEHIQPRVKGGQTTLDNLALACPGCNSFKHAKTDGIDPVTHNKSRLFNPRIDQWEEHFAWSADATKMIGLTPIGRTTVSALKMNRIQMVNFRRTLILYGVHPPT